MEVVGVEFIALNHHIVVATFSATRRWSAPLGHTTEIPMISSNDYINNYKCIKCVVKCLIKQPWTVRTCTPDGPRGR
jgi:hypothetical protein